MIANAPRLRSDLTVSEQRTAGGLCVVVKDSLTGDFFRFGETEQFIARQCDGETPLEVIRQRTEQKFGATLPSQSLRAFIRNLENAGLLEGDETRSARAGKRGRGRRGQGRLRGSLLYLRIKVADPNRLFDRLMPRLRGFFTPGFLVVGSAVILVAVGTAAANWSDIVHDFSRLYRLSAILSFLTVTFLAASAHEFAHGLTCKYFGGGVHELGFMLIYFQPAFYCNVSDAWLFPEKSKRLWVGFAGPYFELFLWALAVLAWRLTQADTVVNYVALIVMTGSGLKTLLNLSPLLKLDGYYLLSDYLDMPNLRRRSFRYLGLRLKKLTGSTDYPAEEPSPRERRLYLTYGLLAAVPSLALLGVAAVKTSGFLIEHDRPIPLALFAGLLAAKTRRRAGRLLGGKGDEMDEDDADASDGSVPAPPPPEPGGGGPSRRARAGPSGSGESRRWRWPPPPWPSCSSGTWTCASRDHSPSCPCATRMFGPRSTAKSSRSMSPKEMRSAPGTWWPACRTAKTEWSWKKRRRNFNRRGRGSDCWKPGRPRIPSRWRGRRSRERKTSSSTRAPGSIGTSSWPTAVC